MLKWVFTNYSNNANFKCFETYFQTYSEICVFVFTRLEKRPLERSSHMIQRKTLNLYISQKY